MNKVREIDVYQANALIDQNALFIDVRSELEFSSAAAQAAKCIVGEELIVGLSALSVTKDSTIVLICQSGNRSLRAAQSLVELGWTAVYSVQGGFSAWRTAGLPCTSKSQLSLDQQARYQRHLTLKNFGEVGQLKLLQSRVVVVGAGGLGSPVALYLAAAGVGQIRIVDHDVVDKSNLQRQILHTDARVGMRKVASAKMSLAALNPEIEIETVAVKLQAENVLSLIQDADVVIDGSDNFPTRYLINDACVKLRKPLVYGAVHQFEGQVSVFNASDDAPCYRCLFPRVPSADAAPNCAEAGVLGVLPGLIGMLQATEAIKILAGIGDALNSRLLCVDALSMQFRELRLQKDPQCAVCSVSPEQVTLAEVDHVQCTTL